jgi:thiamine kinase
MAMAPALPRHIQFKLDQTLAQWPQWQCTPALTRAPQVVRILTPGISNFSVLVESAQRFVVRIDGLNPSANGLSRQTEWRTLRDAHRAGLAPHPRYFNPELGSLVCDYLDPEDGRGHNIADVAQLLRAIHQLPPRHQRLDLAERILRYEKQLEHRDPSVSDEVKPYQGKVMELLAQTRQLAAEPVLCHNDLLTANRIYHDGKLWALDWEYCAMGSPWYDIAVVVNGDSLGPSATDALLETYLGREPDSKERDTLHLYGCIYCYLELLWYLPLDQPLLTQSAIEQKSTALRSMLAQR